MVRLAPEICASRSEMAHPCRGSKASVLRMRRSSVPCGRPVCGIGVIGPFLLRQEGSASLVEVQDERNGFEEERITPDCAGRVASKLSLRDCTGYDGSEKEQGANARNFSTAVGISPQSPSAAILATNAAGTI